MTLTVELAITLIQVRRIMLFATLLLSLFLSLDMLFKLKKLNRKLIVLTLMVIFTSARTFIELTIGFSIKEALGTLVCLCLIAFALISLMRDGIK